MLVVREWILSHAREENISNENPKVSKTDVRTRAVLKLISTKKRKYKEIGLSDLQQFVETYP